MTTITKPQRETTMTTGYLFRVVTALLLALAVAFSTGYLFYEHANLKYPTEDSYKIDYRDGRVNVFPHVATAGGSVGLAEARKPSWCKLLKNQPAYEYIYQGAWVEVPEGRTLHQELKSEGLRGDALKRACRTLVLEFRSHQ